MPIPEKIANDVANKNIEEEKVLEESVSQKAARKAEDVKKLYIEHYIKKNNLDPEDEGVKSLINDLTDRELASGKSFNKLVRQKRDWRELATKENKSLDKNENLDDKTKNETSFEKIRKIEKEKAVEGFLRDIVKKYPDKFKTKESITDAWEKIDSEYKESGNEVRREDFKENLKKAFKISHSSLYEDEIRQAERKRLQEDDVDIGSVVEKVTGESKKKKPKFFVKQGPITDWYKKPNK